jgi:hypothetical protein
MNLGPSYVNAVEYTLTTLAGYLRRHGERNIVLIVLGDHQPPSAVTGEGASWEVPVHVISSRRGILERLRASRFRDGVTPSRPAVGRMHELTRMLLSAFGSGPS